MPPTNISKRGTEPAGLRGQIKETRGPRIDEIVEQSEARLDTVHDGRGTRALLQDLADVMEPCSDAGPIHTALADDCKVNADSTLDEGTLNGTLRSPDRMHQTAQPFSTPFAFKHKKEVLTLKRVTISSNGENGPSLDP